jgi:tetratricopeptide (TPR) repeat protein
MEELDPSRVMRDARMLPKRAGETPFAEKADDLEAIKKAVDDAAAVSGGLWLSYLFVLCYIAIAAGAVTHVDLLLQRPVHLPFLNTELPLLAFFALVPFLFLVTHAYTLAHFVMLGKKTLRFHEQLYRERPAAGVGAEEGGVEQGPVTKEIRDKLRRLLPSNIFVQILAGPPDMRGGVFGLILMLIARTTLVIFPVLLLLLLQSQFLPYHSAGITWVQRIALILDILLLWALWPRIFSFPGEQGTARKKSRAARALRFAIAGALSFATLWLSIVIATIPGERQEKMLAWANPRLPEFWSAVFLTKDKKAIQSISVRDLLFTGEINLTTRRRSSPFSNTLVLPGFSLYEELKIDEPKKLDWKEYSVDLRGRHLEEAELTRADLSRADLTGAWLQGASLITAKLDGASLEESRLQGAWLIGAELNGASLNGAQLQGAMLWAAQLEGASLEKAYLQGASLNAAQLQGASLYKAQLQGALLDGADITAADFSSSFLWRTSSQNVKLGVIRFQSVNWQVKTWLSNSDPVLALTLNVSSSYIPQFAPRIHLARDMSEYYSDLIRRAGSVGGKLGDNAKQRAERLNCANHAKTLESCDGKNPSQVREWQETLKKANGDDETYQTALAAALKKIACASSDDAIYILRGIVGVEDFGGRVYAMGKEAINFVDSVFGHDCPVSSSLTEEDNAALLSVRGTAYANKDDLEHAIADYIEAIRIAPEDEVSYKMRANAYWRNHDYGHAIADLTKWIEFAPEDPDRYKARGNAYQNNHDFDRTITDFTKVIELAPTPEAYENRGQAYLANGSFDTALSDYNKAKELAPKSANILDDRGEAYANKGDYGRAIADYNAAITLEQKDARAFTDRGDVLAAKQDYGRAIADYKEAIKLVPNDENRARVLRHRGFAFLGRNDIERAITDFKEAIKFDTKSAYGAYGVLGLYLARALSGTPNAAAAELEANSA